MNVSPRSSRVSPNYEYLNAVTRARGTRLLSAEQIGALACGTLEGMELFLLESDLYASRYREQLAGDNPSLLHRVEDALAAGSADAITAIFSVAEGEAAFLLSVVLSLGDLYNGQALLRSFTGRDRSVRGPQWHRYALLGTAFYDELWYDCPTPVDAAVRCSEKDDGLAVLLVDAFRHLHTYEDSERARRLLLTRWLSLWGLALREISGRNGERMREFLGRLTDTWNVGVWLRRLSADGAQRPAGGFLPGGWGLSLERLAGTSTARDLFVASGWRFPRDWQEGARASEVHRLFQRAFSSWQEGLYRKDLLGIDVTVGYVARVLSEWRRLSLIAVALSMGLSDREIGRHLTRLGGEEGFS